MKTINRKSTAYINRLTDSVKVPISFSSDKKTKHIFPKWLFLSLLLLVSLLLFSSLNVNALAQIPTSTPSTSQGKLTAKFVYGYGYANSQTILFVAIESTPGENGITSYVWDFGDGNMTISQTNIIMHTYEKTGTYNVTLVETGSQNLEASTTSPITISAPHNTSNNSLWYYSILFVAGLICAIGAVFMKKRNQSGERRNNVETQPASPEFPLLSLTKGTQLPDSYSLMVTGEARAEKGLFCEQLCNYYLKQGKPIIYVTYNRFPAEIRNDLKIHGWDITEWEQKGNFVFVDAYSSIASKKSQEKHYIRQPFGLSDIGIAISSVLNDFQGKCVVVILDSTGPLFTKLDCSKVVEFLQDRCAQIKGQNSMFLFTVATGTIPDNMQNRIEDMVDGLIELKVYDEKGLTKKKITIKKLSGYNYSNVELAVNFPDVVIATEKK